MRVLLFAMWMFLPLVTYAEAPLMRLSSDQVSYSVGANAELSVVALAQPNMSDELFISATFNGAPVHVTQSGYGTGIFKTGALASGANIFTVQLYLEDRVFADQLSASIDALNLQGAQLSTQINQTTDPRQLATLKAQLKQILFLIQESQNELILLRRSLGSNQSLSLVVN
jgi:hypothetical protein